MSKSKFNWRSAAGEVIYIFLGITLAIWFQNWNDDRKEQETALKLSRGIYYENKVNLDALPKTMEQTSSVLSAIKTLMSMMGEHYQEQNPARVDSLMYLFFFTPKFDANEEVIKEITFAGKLELIKEDSLKRQIVRWNLITEKVETMEDMTRKQTAEQILPYLQSRFSILAMDNKNAELASSLPPSAFEVDNRKILAEFEFENLLEMQYYALRYQLKYYEQLLDLMKQLDETLEEKVK